MPDSVLTANNQNEIIEQLAVGNQIIKIGSIHGAIVNTAAEKDQTAVHSRSTPIFILPRPCNKLFNRQEVIRDAIATLKSGQSLELYGSAGSGKSTLLGYLAHNYQLTSSFPDGVISLSPVHPYVGDILQSIWEAFYKGDIPHKQIDRQVYQQIQEKQALIVLDDDNKLVKQDLEELMNAACNCTFLIASSTKRLRHKGVSISLDGLSDSDALTFVEGELQRPLTKEEQPAAQLLCAILAGHPMYLKLVIASILAEGKSLDEVVSQLPTSASRDDLIQQIVRSLSQPQRNILTLLAVMDGVGLRSGQIIAIAQRPDALGIIQALQMRHLVQFDGTHFSVSPTVVAVLPPEWKAIAPQEQVITYFANWAERYKPQPKSLLLEIDAIVQIIDIAVKTSRWQDVLRLVKAVESSIALSRRWSLWEQVLQRGLQASQVEQDRVSEAWALHQLGTCALCLEDNARAVHYLTKAIQLRASFGDKIGVAVTRHNFNLRKKMTPVDQTKLNSVISTDTSNNHPPFLTNSAVDADTSPLPAPEESNNLEISPSQGLLTRMNVVIEDVVPPSQPLYRGRFLSSKGLITTGILASAGLFTWFNWHRFTPTPVTSSSNELKDTPKLLPIQEHKSTKAVSASHISKPVPIPSVTLAPIVESTPKVDPPLKAPKWDTQPSTVKQISEANDRKQLKTESKLAPLPTATPNETFTPAPLTELSQPIPEATPTPTFTPMPTPTSVPQAEALPNHNFAPIPIPQAQATPNRAISPNGIVVPTQEKGGDSKNN